MSLTFVDRYGAPDYGARKGTVAVVLHTTEGGTGRAGALGTAAWQATAGNTSGGSYHEIWGVDGDVVTAVRTVPAAHIAGSISTRRDAVWIADTDAELREFMGAAAVADPNAYLYAISIAGTTAGYDKAGWPKALVDALALRLRQLEKSYGIPDMFVCGHYRFQTNRTDPGLKLIPLVVESYQRQFGPSAPTVPITGTTPPEEDMPDWVNKLVPIAPSRAAIRAGAKLHRSPDASSPVTITLGAQGYTATVVAAVGEDWLIYFANNGGPIFVARADVLRLTPLATDAAAIETLVAAARQAGARDTAKAATDYAEKQ